MRVVQQDDRWRSTATTAAAAATYAPHNKQWTDLLNDLDLSDDDDDCMDLCLTVNEFSSIVNHASVDGLDPDIGPPPPGTARRHRFLKPILLYFIFPFSCLVRMLGRRSKSARRVPQMSAQEYTTYPDQSQPLNKNRPHTPTNRSPSIGIYRIHRLIAAPQ